MRMRCAGTGLLLAAIAAGSPSARADVEDIIKSTFRNAVVKIDVSSLTPIFEGGKNLCVSEGTGFLVSRNHVATAAHVFDVDSRCGQLTILLKSRKHNVTRVGERVASASDVALLRANEDFPAPMCALGLRNTDVYESTGYRFGIPGALQDPVPLRVGIGEKDSEWRPLVRLIGDPAEFGESGGPVIYYFNVVGILKAKHKSYTAYSFMMVASVLKNLMQNNNVTAQGRICNPVELLMEGPNEAGFRLQPNTELSATARSEVWKAIRDSTAAVSESVPEMNAMVEGSNVTISARTKVIERQSCTKLLGSFKWCVPRLETIDAPVVANQSASAIRDKASSDLWRTITMADNY